MRSLVFTGVCVAALSACASDAPSDDAGLMEGAIGDAPDPSEQCPSTIPEFRYGPTGGLTVTDPKTNVTMRLDDVSASPPERDYNDWKVALTDATGAPLPNAHLTWACTWMAVHAHGTNPKRVDDLGNGEFGLYHLNFSMYGPWQLQLWVDPTGASPAYAPQTVSGVANGNACSPSSGVATGTVPNITLDLCVPRSRGN